MSSKHTPTPWAVAQRDKSFILDANDVPLARVYYFDDYSNTQHIVDCVNACEGQEIETVQNANFYKNQSIELEAANERLVSALQGLINAINPLDRLRTLDHAEVEAINDANQLLVELAQEGGSHE
jgi:hypothetical protein